jgi:hypothetical protein
MKVRRVAVLAPFGGRHYNRKRRGVRAVERARLESECWGNPTGGSNPPLSAITKIPRYIFCEVGLAITFAMLTLFIFIVLENPN